MLIGDAKLTVYNIQQIEQIKFYLYNKKFVSVNCITSITNLLLLESLFVLIIYSTYILISIVNFSY